MMQDVKVRYLAGGSWKRSIIAKAGKHRHESTRPGGIRVLIPPPEGWKGGLPEDNGCRKRGR